MVGGLSPPRRTLSMGSGGAMARRAAAAATATDSPRPGLSRSMYASFFHEDTLFVRLVPLNNLIGRSLP